MQESLESLGEYGIFGILDSWRTKEPLRLKPLLPWTNDWSLEPLEVLRLLEDIEVTDYIPYYRRLLKDIDDGSPCSHVGVLEFLPILESLKFRPLNCHKLEAVETIRHRSILIRLAKNCEATNILRLKCLYLVPY